MEKCILDAVIAELEFYAKKGHYKAGSENRALNLSIIMDDGGERARELLKRLTGDDYE